MSEREVTLQVDVLFASQPTLRIMVIKNGAYNSLWQLIGDIKPNETKVIPLPAHQGQSVRDSSPAKPMIEADASKQYKGLHAIEQSTPVQTKAHDHREAHILSNPTMRTPSSGDQRRDQITMAEIEDHQRRHTYANSLVQAQQNYRELRRLLIKMNGRTAGGKKPRQMSEKQTKDSTGQRT